MLVIRGPEEQAAPIQVRDQLAGELGILHETSLVAADARVVGSIGLDRVEERARSRRVETADSGRRGRLEVVLPERRRDVHQAGAVRGRHEVGRDDRKAAVRARIEDRPRVGDVDQLATGEALQDLGALAQYPLDQRRRQHIDALVRRRPLSGALRGPTPTARAHILDVWRHRDRPIARQRPRRRRPDQQGVALTQSITRGSRGEVHRQAHVHRGVYDIPIAQRDLVRGERRPAARAVRHHLVPLVEQALRVDLGERPPDRLDIGLVQRAVGVVEVDPEADALGEAVPLLQVLEHRLAAARVEALDPEPLDLGLRGDSQLLFDRDLDRQAVAVPAALALDAVAAHRLVARVDVLEDPREHMVGARAAVRRWRALVEDPRLRVRAHSQRLREDIALAPAPQHLLLERRQHLPGVDLTWRDQRMSLQGRHGPLIVGAEGAGGRDRGSFAVASKKQFS
jgi:hypothetical protein